MSKNISFLLLASALVLVSCSDVKRQPGSVYMPDMAYSRAYESYADYSNLAQKNINYTGTPVAGAIARGEDLPFHIPMDAPGDTTNYTASKAVKNPIVSLTDVERKEAERLYLINCGICHGANLNGNGPLYKDGAGPYPAKPASLVGDAKYEAMPDGQMFYSLAYGKNLMGSYASQLSRKQRWMIIKYIKDKQQEGKAAATDTTAKK
ncbi:MAG: cytochrome c [Chitinophagaceae bacterium]|jgi:mono/diheme cytochrome c family protein|nr:cytochrome c [Chitinophagaceae bacterium]MCA6470143.1 cytochrome c [Chitinophagaceae bacterium]MCA6478815.1 cytochrome c [Chitinophagaceae bacterium]MCA6480493.1 cytochrome c [Chitinophagaceae bacterium]